MKNSRHSIVLFTLAASLGGFLYGYDTGIVSGTIGFLKTYFQLNPKLIGWTVASVVIGGMFGSASAGFIGDRYGRKWSLIGCAILFMSATILTACANSIVLFTIARFLGGVAIGAASMLSPLYIAEIAPAQIRGKLVTCYQLAIVVAICLVFFINLQVQHVSDETWNVTTGWRWMFASAILPAGLFGGCMLLASESPRWLMKAGRRKEARIVLEKMVDRTDAELEIQHIEQSLNEEQGRWSELFTTGYRRALFVGILLAAFGQLSGINAIMYYAAEIFKTAGETHATAFIQTATIGLINFLFTLVAIVFVDRAGRKPLLLIGALLQTISLLSAGFLLHNNLTGPLLLFTVLVYVAAYAAAMGPITWIINSEIFPSKLRGRAMSIAILTLWAANFLVTQTFPMLNQTWGIAKTFWIYAFFNLLSFFFALFILPETKNRTLEEIEHYWIARK